MRSVSALNAEQIAEELRLRIRSRQWAPGMAINQKQLASDLGVSRMPVREALQALNSEGLVILSPGQGAKVVELEREDIADLYDLRLALEPRLAPDVIDGLSPRDHQRLAELSSLMHDAREHDGSSDELHRDQWSNLNHEFHEHMYVAAGRHHTVRVVLQLMELVEPYSWMYVHLLGGVDRASAEHDEMVTAIETRCRRPGGAGECAPRRRPAGAARRAVVERRSLRGAARRCRWWYGHRRDTGRLRGRP